MTYFAPLVAILVTFLAIAILLSGKTGKIIQDIPNERSLHKEPVPRVGGIALMSGVLSGWLLMFASLAWWVVLPVMALFAVSLLDDVRGLPVWQRLLVHFFAAVILILGSGVAARGAMPALIVVLCTVWMTNLYNFMDGSDGLAGGMTLFGFAMYGVAALMHGDELQAMLNFSIGAAALGFLFYNFYPAKIFMGDAGSIPLGFLAAAMGLWGWQHAHWPGWFPLLVFSPFIVDASITLLKRTIRGLGITEAHREHYYQRLVQIGWGHRNTALLEYILMFATGASAIWSLRQSPEFPWLLFLIWFFIYAALILSLDWHWKSLRRERHD